MATIIFDGSTCRYILSDAALVDWPHVTDGETSFIVGLAFTPTIVSGVSCPDGIDKRFVTCADDEAVIDTDGWSAFQQQQLADAISAKLQALSDYCIAKANGGTTVGGFPIASDLQARTDLNGSFTLATLDPTFTTKWIPTLGQSIVLTAEQIIAIAPAIGKFYSGCYDTQADHAAAIQELTSVEAVEAYDFTTGWPSVTN